VAALEVIVAIEAALPAVERGADVPAAFGE
jgi:hypothetical protein